MNLRIAETLDGHSGFVFPKPIQVLLGNYMAMNPIMGTEPSYHDYHHSRNMGNYSTFFTVWDTVFGTNKEYYKMVMDLDKEQSKEEQNKTKIKQA